MKIKWALNELKKYEDEPLQLSGQVDLEKELKARNDQILSASPVQVEGILVVEKQREYLVDLKLTVDLTLPSSRSLEPVAISLPISFSETYLAPGHVLDPDDYTEEEIVIELETDRLDLQKPLEDSILTALPTQVLTKEEQETNKMPSGNEWEVISEEEYREGTEEQSDGQENSPFAALKDLFPEEENE